MRALLLLSCIAVLSPGIAAADDAVTVTVAGIHETRGRSFEKRSEDEIVFDEQPSLRVTALLSGQVVADAVRYRDLKIKAVDDKSNVLQQQRTDFGPDLKDSQPLDRSQMWFGVKNPPRDKIKLAITLDTPPRSATKIATLEGSVKLLAGKSTDVLIKDPGRHVGKTLDAAELKSAEVNLKLTEFNPKGGPLVVYAKIKATGKLDAISRIDIVDDKDNPLSTGSSVVTGLVGATTYEILGEDPLPETARLKITLITDVKEIEVPIKLRDVELP